MMLVLLTILAFNFEAGRLTLEKKDSIYITKMVDSVRIYNDTMEIRGRIGIYNERENTLFLKGGVVLVTPKRKAKSDSLVIRKDGDIILFMGGAEIREGRDTLRANKIYIEGDSLAATFDVRGYFHSKKLRFTADTLYAVDSSYILKGSGVRIVSIDTDSIVLEGSPVYVKEDTLYSPSRCQVTTGKYIGEGDTLYYFTRDSLGFFLGDVKMEWDSGYATGDTAYFYIGDSGLDSVIVRGDCFLENRGENEVQLRGKKFKVTVKKSKMVKLEGFEATGVLREKENE